MYEELSKRIVEKTQRPHRCSWCGDLVPIGGNGIRRTYKFDGDFVCDFMHMECHRAMIAMPHGNNMGLKA